MQTTVTGSGREEQPFHVAAVVERIHWRDPLRPLPPEELHDNVYGLAQSAVECAVLGKEY